MICLCRSRSQVRERERERREERDYEGVFEDCNGRELPARPGGLPHRRGNKSENTRHSGRELPKRQTGKVMNFRKEDDGQERGVENQKLNFFFF